MTRPVAYSTIALALSLILPVPGRSQQASAPTSYPDTASGLHHLLQNVFKTAIRGDQDELTATVKDMEIPNPGDWFAAAFGAERGRDWADAYRTELDQNQKDLQHFFLQNSKQAGDIVTKKMNDNPHFAAWRPRSSNDAPARFIGYFIFIDGQFRWLPSVVFATSRCLARSAPRAAVESSVATAGGAAAPLTPGVDGVGFPKCAYCPAPQPPSGQRAEKYRGTVVLNVTIQPDGHATDIKIAKSLGTSIDQVAVKAVQSWKFTPARDRNGNPVAVKTSIAVTFRLL